MDQRGYHSKWAKGASYLVDELADAYVEGATSGGIIDNAGPLLKDLNIKIATFAVSNFSNVLYGDGAKGLKSYMDWYGWDLKFVKSEQGEVALDAYSGYEGSKALDDLNDISRHEGGLGFLAKYAPVHFIPNFATFSITLTHKDDRFGEEGRINLPMYMLWPSTHQSHQIKNGFPALNNNQIKEINRANAEIMEYYKQNSKF